LDLTQTRDSQFRVEKDLCDMHNSFNAPEVLDLDDVETTMVSLPPTTDSSGNKRSNLAILAENNENVKRVKKENDDTARRLEDAEDEQKCSVCLTAPKTVFFSTCNHLLCCKECAGKVEVCLVCRLGIVNRTAVYVQIGNSVHLRDRIMA